MSDLHWGEMYPGGFIVTALAAGAVLGLKDTSSTAMKDAHAWVKVLIARRMAGRTHTELVQARHAEAPAVWDGSLAAELASAGADRGHDLPGAAQALMRLAGETGFRIALPASRRLAESPPHDQQ